MLKIHSRADHEIGEVHTYVRNFSFGNNIENEKNDVPIPQSCPLQEFRPEQANGFSIFFKNFKNPASTWSIDKTKNKEMAISKFHLLLYCILSLS